MPISSDYFYSDSKTVIQWLRREPHNWPTFEANWVSEIQSHTDPSQWRHLAGIFNTSADAASMGLTPSEILKFPDWFTSPKFLYGSHNSFPVSLTVEEPDPDLYKKASTTLLAKPSSDRPKSLAPTLVELREATLFWIRVAQDNRLISELLCIKGGVLAHLSSGLTMKSRKSYE
ncbi:hypothetical protein TCAL_12809 [Tigriopus californicus]|uniref:Uncharacterized protein n=1 Tax=Tigriopus californicus TaxID=6832 RepID=A0A553PQF2_TIGCA|nr:hypothetical protein TCAL_12809 [Tigriopus californicus]